MRLHLAVLGVYVVLLLALGLWARRRTKTLADYYVGGGRVPTLLVAFSYYATYVSTISFIGHAGMSYVYGVAWMVVGAVLVLFTVLAWIFIAGRFRELAGRLGSVCPSDFFRLHYRSTAAGSLAAFIILFDSVWYLGAVMLGASAAVGSLLGIRFEVALAGVFVVQVGYTFLGGYLADVWTDSVQAVLMLAAAVALPLLMLTQLGGWEAAWRKLAAVDVELMSRDPGRPSLVGFVADAPWLFILGVALAGGLKMVADPRQISRFYGLESGASTRIGVVVAPLAMALTYLCLLPLGLFARAYHLPPAVAARSDAIIPYLLGEGQLLGPVLGAVVLTSLVAAAMSTMDSVLLVASASFQRDILPLFRRTSDWSEPKSLGVARLGVAAYALLPLTVAAVAHARPGSSAGIVELTAFAGALYAGAFLPGLLGALYWRGASRAGVVWGMVCGATAATAWKFFGRGVPALADVHEVFIGLAAGGAAFLLGSLLRPPRAT